MGKPNSNKQSICIIAATPLTIYFFFLPHIIALSEEYNVTVVFDPSNDSYLGDLKLVVRTVPIKMARKLNPFQDLISLLYLYKFFRKNHFDLVVSVAPKAGLLTMLAATISSSAKRVHIFQGEFWASKTGILRFILKQADTVTAFLAHQVLAVSKSERNFLAQENIVRLEKVDVLGEGSIGGVNAIRYRFDNDARSNIRQELSIPENAIVALFIGRVVADKGIFELIQAFAKNYVDCPNLYLLIVGPDEDDANETLFSGVTAVRDRVKIIGFTRTPELYMSASDFVCLPSYREGFPITILEASAIGIPTIGTNIYGICDAIEANNTGILVTPRNVNELFEAINILYYDKNLRDSLGANARARVLNFFQQDIVVKRYIDYFAQAIQAKNTNTFYMVVKRVIDFALSFIASIILFIPMLLIGFVVALTSKGPVIYWSDRIGRDGSIFKMAKFRSMRVEAPILATDCLINPEQFITPIGNFLRKTSLDELPQLWNILRGDMSFVGPRPALFNQTSLIEMRTKFGVNALRPGLTGLAQINGRDVITDDEKVKFDIEYLQKKSLWLDFKILCLTFSKVLRGDGVIH